MALEETKKRGSLSLLKQAILIAHPELDADQVTTQPDSALRELFPDEALLGPAAKQMKEVDAVFQHELTFPEGESNLHALHTEMQHSFGARDTNLAVVWDRYFPWARQEVTKLAYAGEYSHIKLYIVLAESMLLLSTIKGRDRAKAESVKKLWRNYTSGSRPLRDWVQAVHPEDVTAGTLPYDELRTRYPDLALYGPSEGLCKEIIATLLDLEKQGRMDLILALDAELAKLRGIPDSYFPWDDANLTVAHCTNNSLHASRAADFETDTPEGIVSAIMTYAPIHILRNTTDPKLLKVADRKMQVWEDFKLGKGKFRRN